MNNSKNKKAGKIWNNWLYNHLTAKYILEYLCAFLVSTISALLFGIAINAFIIPSALIQANEAVTLITGGASGISQNITTLLIIILGENSFDESSWYSVIYFIVNIPLVCISFFKIGKRFTILTFVNILEASIVIKLLNSNDVEIVYQLAKYVNDNGGVLCRILFGGVLVGLSSALPYKYDFSAGGLDILCYLISLVKKTSTGKFTLLFNSITIATFGLLQCERLGWGDNTIPSLAVIIYGIVYLFVVSNVIDRIHLRNKKCELKIISEDQDLVDVLLTKIPHGATITKGIGAYSGDEKLIVSMVISSYELNHIISIINEEDPKAFIEVYELNQLYGRFYMKSIK